ncbi:UNVERIFIED_CONTAM: Pyruvate kinase, cytosolic [Sesamum angustifolium]|uniref:Pyruvate kinase n=1 Tax=Sesamum angustifolium TaxID=2727405 RepID=A0AAW2MRQ2_9LAMI
MHSNHLLLEEPIRMATILEPSKGVISSWGAQNKIDFLSLSYTRHAEDVREARDYLSKLGDLSQTQIFAKIENVEGLTHFDDILQEADGIILSRGNLGIDLPPEKARQSLVVRGLFPLLADPRHPAASTNPTHESVLNVALDHGKASGVIKSHDRVVVCQKVGDAAVVKIIELED